jgi:ABC-type molybdate transport system substrate-binding protein
VPAEDYPLLRQGGVVLNAAQDRDAAWQFRDFLLSGEAREILKSYGFDVPGE